MRPFNMLRACFYLLATVMLIEVFTSIVAGFSCFYLNLITVQTIGACVPIVEVIREQWAEMLAAILALLLAARGIPPDDKDKE